MRAENSKTARISSLLRLLPIAAAVAAPAAALLWLRAGTGDAIDAVDSHALPQVVPAVARTILDDRRIIATLTTTEGKTVRAPQWTGTVTEVAVEPGGQVVSGQRLATISGVARLGVASPQPFYRRLQQGDSGTDVAALNGVLTGLGYLAAVPAEATQFTPATTQAVRLLEQDLGIGAPTGVFDAAWFAWLPVTPFAIGDFVLEVGAPAPPVGSIIAKEPPKLARVVVAPANPGEALALDPAVKWVLVVGTEQFGVNPATLEVDAAALPRLQKLMKPKSDRIDGILQRAVPLQAAAIPSTAVSVGPQGQLCAWLPEATGGYRARPLTIAGARGGVTNITDGVAAGQEVLANPAEVLESTVCP
ncbi:MAG: hypothetical protein HY875_14180 [Chloroflexi bacterium]|nr:hypothetical protein [Chloroflexota bacterium]